VRKEGTREYNGYLVRGRGVGGFLSLGGGLGLPRGGGYDWALEEPDNWGAIGVDFNPVEVKKF